MSSEPDSSYIEKVVEFYNQNGQDFYQRTAELDMAELYDRFLPYLPDEGSYSRCGMRFRKRCPQF